MIKVGLTEMHGIAKEYSLFPPANVEYSAVDSNSRYTKYIFKSQAKGVYAYVSSSQHDIIEAPIFPVLTAQPWIFTPAHFSSAGAFDLFGVPTPRTIKMLFVEQLLSTKNFKKLIFKSEYGRQSLNTYGRISNREILKKTDVIHPVVRRVEDSKISFQDKEINLLFIGEFLRKGGANVVDAFYRLAKEYSHLTLTLCSSENFQTSNTALKSEYLKKIHNHDRIEIKFIDREKLLNNILPKADIYLCPTYQESWGFSIQEAMAFGKPIIASNISAIPEMIEHNVNGILIDIKDNPFIRKSKGYVVNTIDREFMSYLTGQIYKETKRLIESLALRKKLGLNALNTARSKFSIETRNAKMRKIYEEALS